MGKWTILTNLVASEIHYLPLPLSNSFPYSISKTIICLFSLGEDVSMPSTDEKTQGEEVVKPAEKESSDSKAGATPSS